MSSDTVRRAPGKTHKNKNGGPLLIISVLEWIWAINFFSILKRFNVFYFILVYGRTLKHKFLKYTKNFVKIGRWLSCYIPEHIFVCLSLCYFLHMSDNILIIFLVGTEEKQLCCCLKLINAINIHVAVWWC